MRSVRIYENKDVLSLQAVLFAGTGSPGACNDSAKALSDRIGWIYF